MKLRIVWIIFFISIFSLLSFQSIWLLETYKLKKKEIQNSINIQLVESIEKELKNRLEKSDLKKEEMQFMDENTAQSTEEYQSNKIFEVEGNDVLETGIFQYLLHFSGYPFYLNNLDTIFHNTLILSNTTSDYLLIYKDSTGAIIEQTGNLSSSKIDRSFKTNPLLIVDGKRVEAIVNISPSVIFKQMFWLLVASFLMLLIILCCTIYQVKTIFTQYKLNQLREDFTNALTHDMKTPLGTINIVLSQFREGVLDDEPELKEKLGRIAMEQVSGLLMLVEKILIIAKLEQEKLTLDYAIVDLPEMVKELKSRVSLSKDKEVTIYTSFELDDQSIYLDKTLIKNAIGNLIDNAIKYSGNRVVIHVDCYIRDKQLFIRIKDNGFGISDRDKQKIFEKFERGAAIGRKGAKGFGLGLNYVKRVTEAHGGIVVLYSKEGEGSEFTIVLPFIAPE